MCRAIGGPLLIGGGSGRCSPIAWTIDTAMRAPRRRVIATVCHNSYVTLPKELFVFFVPFASFVRVYDLAVNFSVHNTPYQHWKMFLFD